MKTVTELPRLRELVTSARAEGKSIGFVPTMGALHDGHLSLVRAARRECGFVVVSIFVNPLQFGPGEDFQRYPHSKEKDQALLEEAGADVVYLPDAARFYPEDFSTSVAVREVSDGGEGAVRPGHFGGVATVVAKLFVQVQPDAAYFGRKDLQQTAVVRRLIRDLDFPIGLEVRDTVREPDGLAMSSRNAYLSAEERARASAFPGILIAAGKTAALGSDARALERNVRGELENAGLPVDYVQVVDPRTMRPTARVGPGTALAAAIRLGKTRLIDNVLLHSDGEKD